MFKKLLAVAYCVLIIWVALNGQTIRDRWYLYNYRPSAEVASLSSRASLSAKGTDYFFLGEPVIHTKEVFNESCTVRENSLTLGCYNLGVIHILRVEREELESVVPVTVAHETLHVAYDRLSTKERERINTLNEAVFEKQADERLRGLIKQYEETQPGSKANELHSLLPTQILELPAELEEYYSQYFVNRRKVAAQYQQYESVFTKIKEDIAVLEGTVTGLKNRFGDLQAGLDAKAQKIETLGAIINASYARDDLEAAESAIGEYNATARAFNRDIDALNDIVDQHNTAAQELAGVVIEQNSLTDSLNSQSIEKLDTQS